MVTVNSYPPFLFLHISFSSAFIGRPSPYLRLSSLVQTDNDIYTPLHPFTHLAPSKVLVARIRKSLKDILNLFNMHKLHARSPHSLLVNLPVPTNPTPAVGSFLSPSVTYWTSSTQLSSPPNTQPASISTAGSGVGNSNGIGSTPPPTDLPTSNKGAVAPPPSSVSSSTSVPGKFGGDNTAPPLSSGNGNYLGTPPPVPVSVGTTSATLGMSSPTVLPTNLSSPSQSSLGYSPSSSTTGTVVPLSTTTATATATVTPSRKYLSGSAIAGITVVCLFFLLALILLAIRRRSIARRLELRRRWWSTRNTSSRSFFFGNRPRSPVESDVSARRLSARSSFATNFDQGLMFRVHSPSRCSPSVVPDLPPLAEVRERNAILISTGAAVKRRESMNNMLSIANDRDGQYITSPAGQKSPDSTPMFVRPFTPSELFAFPKPPTPLSSTADSFLNFGTQASASSETVLAQLSTPPRAFMTDLPPAPVKTPIVLPQKSTTGVTLTPFITAASPSVDPFVNSVKPEFANIQIIRRPFEPTMYDELPVRPGDRVHILKIFDDGWAIVDKLAGTEGGSHGQGLIPFDCLREADQTLPTSLTREWVNSQRSEQPTAIAL